MVKKEKGNKPTFDKGKMCLCGKPAASLISRPGTMTRAGPVRHHHMAGDMMNFRNPDPFSMHTFNDHIPYGALKIVQNVMLKFREAFKVA